MSWADNKRQFYGLYNELFMILKAYGARESNATCFLTRPKDAFMLFNYVGWDLTIWCLGCGLGM